MTDHVYRELSPIQGVKYEPLGIELLYAPESKKVTPSSISIKLSNGRYTSLAKLVKAVYEALPPIQRIQYEPLGLELIYSPEVKKITPNAISIALPEGGFISLGQLVEIVKTDYENFHRRILEASYKSN